MSAIGDYIHYSKKGYDLHGATKAGSDEGPIAVFRVQRNKIFHRIAAKKAQEKLNPKEIQNFENALTNIMRPATKNQESLSKDIWNIIMGYMQQEFQESLGVIEQKSANIFSGLVFSDYSNLSDLSKISKNKTGSNKETYLKTVIKRINILYTNLNNVKNIKQRNELQKFLNSMIQSLEEIFQIEKMVLNETGYSIPQSHKNAKMLVEGKYENVIDEINKIVASIGLTIGLQKGTLFETMIALAPIMAGQKALKESNQLLKTIVGTTGKTSVQIDTSQFSSQINNWESILKSHYKKDINSSLYVATKASQDKIDVNLVWNNKIVPISAKNINLQGAFNIHLVTDASMLTMIQDENQNNFINHYLNVFAEHEDGKISNTELTMGTEVMKLMLLLKAFEGYKRGAGKAELFVVNDNKTGNVKVYSIASLMEKASKAINLYTEITANGKDLSYITLRNRWYDGGYSPRLESLISHLHSLKISAALRKNLL